MLCAKEIKRGTYVMHKGAAYVINDVSIEGDCFVLKLDSLFSSDSVELSVGIDSCLEEADVRRKCGSLLFKKKGKAEILDTETFEQLNAEIDEDLFEKASEGDQITYIRFGDSAKVVEIRKI